MQHISNKALHRQNTTHNKIVFSKIKQMQWENEKQRTKNRSGIPYPDVLKFTNSL